MTESIRDRKRNSPRPKRNAARVSAAPAKALLSEHERAEIKALLDRGQPLPERYRDLLFARPEAPRLVWAGKHGAEVAEPRALVPRERYGSNAAQDGWRDLLIEGDNGAALAALAKPPFSTAIESAGGLKLIYIDPPFAAQQDFSATLAFGEQPGSSRVRYAAYGDCWAGHGEAYLSLMFERLRAMHGLLAEDGFLFLHCDWRSHAALRLILDEVFGCSAFVNEIVWHYYNKYSAGRRCLPRSHDSILLYAKNPARAGKLNPLRLPRAQPVRQLVRENVNGVLRNARGADGKLRYREVSDRKLSDVWEIPQLQPASGHWSGYPTQKHPRLLERILALCSDPGDLVADFFAGSGTLPVVARAMGRRWIACDASPVAIHTARKRLLAPVEGGPASFDFLESVPRDDFTLFSPQVCSVEAEAVQGSGGITVRISGFSPAPFDQAARSGVERGDGFDRLTIERGRLVRRNVGKGGAADTVEILTRDWSDWIDYWAVAPAESDSAEGIAPVWWTLRRRGARGLALETPPLNFAQRVAEVSVLIIDPFGRRSLARVPIQGR